VNQGMRVSPDLDAGSGLEDCDLIGWNMSRQADLALDQGSDHGPGMWKAKLPYSADRCHGGGCRRAGDFTVGAAQLDRTVRRRNAQKQAVADELTTLLHGGHPAVNPCVRRADWPLEPGTQLVEGTVEPDLDPGVVGRFDTVEQVGPPRLELGRAGIAAIDERPRHVRGGHLAGSIGPGNSAPQPEDQATTQV